MKSMFNGMSTTGLALGAALVLAGCGAEAPSNEDVKSSEATLLATFELSGTHRIEFYEHAESGVVSVSEVSSLDGDQPIIESLLAPEGEELSLREVYLRVAGPEAKSDVVQLLADADLRASAIRAQLPAQGVGAEVAERIDLDVEASGEKIGSTRQAICAEPPWDWFADDLWFKQRCIGYSYCDSLEPRHSYSTKGNTVLVTGFGQSHCSAATMQVHWSLNTWCGLLPCSKAEKVPYPVAPRQLRSVVWSGTVDRWTLSIASDQGNFTGLGVRKW